MRRGAGRTAYRFLEMLSTDVPCQLGRNASKLMILGAREKTPGLSRGFDGAVKGRFAGYVVDPKTLALEFDILENEDIL